jgi:hypothetical protein
MGRRAERGAVSSDAGEKREGRPERGAGEE